MKTRCILVWAFVTVLGLGTISRATAEDPGEATWLLEYDGSAPPQAPAWTASGGLAAKAQVADGALRIVDDSDKDTACFRAAWKPDPACETIVEAGVRVVSVKAWRGGTMFWPCRDGAPVGLLVSDGRRQEGFVLRPRGISTFMDRFFDMDTTKNFHVYRLVIRGDDMSVFVDGERKILGRDAFGRPADSPEPFIQFGSSCSKFTGEAYWDYVKLGLRKAPPAEEKEALKITVSEPWEIPPAPKIHHTRPYLYNVGQGLLLLSVAQGPDKIYEPYGILRSADAGKTWTPVEGLQLKTFAPQPMIRLPGGDILGISRWNVKYEDGVYVGMSCRFDPQAQTFTLFENTILMPKEATPIIVFDRHIFDAGGGSLWAVVYDNYHGYLLKTTDEGKTLKHFSTIAKGEEPAVAILSETEMTAVLRQTSMAPLVQTWSHDGGKTWDKPVTLEEGSVAPDLVLMSNGVLACSYGRPGSCLMFSTDGGKTWPHHRIITEQTGFNYTAIAEVRPGRLLYLHDAPKLKGVYVDVEREK